MCLVLFVMIGALAFLGSPWSANRSPPEKAMATRLSFVLGMLSGAAISHNLPDSLVDGVSPFGIQAVIIGLAVCLLIGFSMRQKVV